MNKSFKLFKFNAALIALGLVMFAVYLWTKTPDLFVNFNHAFCPH
ncbi:hypothetical protein [Bartonella sp. HY038]|nr:hypothetical protein [Bartonella sp. HY038]